MVDGWETAILAVDETKRVIQLFAARELAALQLYYVLPATPAMLLGIPDTSGSNEVQAVVILSSRHIEDNGTKALQQAAPLQAELLFPLVGAGYMEESIYNKTLPSRTPVNGAAAMLQAARDGDVPAVERLLSDDPRLVRASDEHLKTPLHWAAEHDRRDIAEMLLDAGADLEATTSWGATALDWAATMGSTKVADLLLARGAKGMNLVAAASLGKLDLVREFLDSGAPLASLAGRAAPAEPNDHWVADSARMKGDVISNAFYGACRNGHTAVAALLLERGADINAKGVFGGTGLHWAAINGHKNTVAFLVAHGADLTIRDANFDSTPEGWAAEGQREEIRELLHRS